MDSGWIKINSVRETETVIDNEKYRDRERNTQKERVVSSYVRS